MPVSQFRKNVFGAVAVIAAGVLASLVITMSSRAGLELVPNRDGETKPTEFCRYTIALFPSSGVAACQALKKPKLNIGDVVCTQCPNGGEDGRKCRIKGDKQAFIPLQGIEIHKTGCLLRLNSGSSACDDCDAGGHFFWLESA